MNKRIIPLVSILLLIVLAATLLSSCGSSSSPAPSATGGSSAGQTLMETRCSACHSVGRITSAHKTADQWKTTVDRMINNGAKLNSQEEQTLIDYLAQNYK
jgi:hypothetical protein